MADRRLLAIGSGIAQGLEKANSNIYNIMQAGKKLQMEQEAFKLDKKVKEAALKKNEFDIQIALADQEQQKKNMEFIMGGVKNQVATQNAFEAGIQQGGNFVDIPTPNDIGSITPPGTKTEMPPERANMIGGMSSPDTVEQPQSPAERIPAGMTMKLGGGMSIRGSGGAKWTPKTREEQLGFERDKARAQAGDLSSLSPEQQLQALTLAKETGGVRKMAMVLPTIVGLMKQGKSMDEIQDSLRYASQSLEFEGPVREAAQSIYANTNDTVAQKGMDYIDDLLSKGDMEGVKSQLKRATLMQAGPEERKRIMGEERTIGLLDEIQGDLDKLKEKGVDTGLIRGTWEQISNKLGKTSDPEVRQTLTKIRLAVMNYRRAMSGVAFPEAETKQYQDVFPDIGKEQGFNAANINALKDVFSGDLETFYGLSMGYQAYDKLFGGDKTIEMINPENGKRYSVPISESEEASKNGWRV